VGACRGRPRFSFGAASPFGNVVVEVGRSLVLCGNRGLLLRARVGKSCYLLASPRYARRQWFSCLNGRGGQGGSGASAVCGYRHLEDAKVCVRVRQGQIDAGSRPGTTSEESAELKRLRRESAELRRVNAILKTASAFFASMAETINGLYKTGLIRPRKPWRTIEEVELATAEWVHW